MILLLINFPFILQNKYYICIQMINIYYLSFYLKFIFL
nr:MAG TPA: hypothetical protein [Caudoviricetes sp.]DAX61719.1 MAG TPA: hypothetical protein [Caudoviricetes sp.]